MSAKINPSAHLGDEAARVRLGGNIETPVELLYFLARDESVTVRAAVALNQSTPTPADAVLANDVDDRVRAVLGRKIALMAAGLCHSGQNRLERVVRSLLGSLVTDEAERVRAMIADALKDLPHAPADVIQKLAQDTAISVSEPIIRFSPLLSESDLLQLLAAPPCPGTPGAVARRAGLSETISDAVVATANSAAIRDLLGNHSAAIREATLDSLVCSAKEHAGWHEPLACRPSLSQTSMQLLSHILADHLLGLLAERADLEPQVKDELRTRITDKLARQNLESEKAPQSPEYLLTQVRAMERAGGLTESAVTQAVRSGEENLVVAMMAVAANVPVAMVERAVALHSAKGLVSLIWRAGFSMRSAVAIQVLLARLPPRGIVTATQNGGFPLSADEMRWQLEFLEHAAH